MTSTTTLTEPPIITISTTSTTSEVCGQGNGEFQLAATGGTGILTYTEGTTSNTTGLFQNLSAGTYTVTVTDQNNCSKDITVTIPNIPSPNPVIDYQQDVACAGGLNGAVTISVSISTGTAPFLFDLDNTGSVPTNTFNVNAGPHNIVVTDANSCTGNVSFVIGQPAPLSFTTATTNASCNSLCDGEITITASGGTAPYQYSKDNGLSFQNSPVLSGLCAGTIFIVVKDCLLYTSPSPRD